MSYRLIAADFGKLLQRPLASTRRDKQHWLLAPLHVDEHGNVVVAALAGRLIQADTSNVAQIKLRDRLCDVVLHDAPQPRVGDVHQARRSQHRHLPNQGESCLFKQQRESAPLARPGHFYLTNTVLGALHPRHRGRDVAVVLEEVVAVSE